MYYSLPLIIIGFLQAIIVAVIGGLFTLETKKRKKEHESFQKMHDLRATESKLSMQMMFATMQLSVVTARCVRKEDVNGDLDAARKEAEAAKKEYRNFINMTVAEQLAKSKISRGFR